MPKLVRMKGREFRWEKERRITHAEHLIARQYTGRVILQKLAEKYKVDQRTAYTYLGIAFQRLAADAENDRPIRKARMRLTLQAMRRTFMATKDGASANRAADMLCKIDGLYAAEKIKVDVTVGVPMQIEQVIDVLDDAGRSALELVLAQVEAANVKALPPGDEDAAAIALPGMPEWLADDATVIDAESVPAKPKRSRRKKRTRPRADDAKSAP